MPDVVAPIGKSGRREKHRAHRADRTNPLAVTIFEDTFAPAEGVTIQEVSSVQPLMADITQVTMADVAFTGIPTHKSHGTAVPVAEEGTSVQKGIGDPVVGANFLQATGGGLPSL